MRKPNLGPIPLLLNWSIHAKRFGPREFLGAELRAGAVTLGLSLLSASMHLAVGMDHGNTFIDQVAGHMGDMISHVPWWLPILGATLWSGAAYWYDGDQDRYARRLAFGGTALWTYDRGSTEYSRKGWPFQDLN